MWDYAKSQISYFEHRPTNNVQNVQVERRLGSPEERRYDTEPIFRYERVVNTNITFHVL